MFVVTWLKRTWIKNINGMSTYTNVVGINKWIGHW